MTGKQASEAGTQLRVATRHSAERVETLQEPTPGTYWRVRANVRGRHDDRMDTNALRRGLVLMLASVEYADGAPHVYCFAPHPSWPKPLRMEPRFHADDFYVYFEPELDAERVRAGELAQLLGDMDETKRLMLEPPPDAVPVGLLTHDPMAAVGGEGSALATPDQLRSITQYAGALQEDAEKRSAWIQKHSGDLGRQGTTLANFHLERAAAALARASAQLEGVKGLLKTVENLRLYTGEGIELMPLRGGAPAPADARVTIYQEVLSLDEEALILLDQGGLDHTQTDALIDALEDPALLTRLIPAERGVVLVRFRRSYKEFVRVSEKASAAEATAARVYNSAMSDESKRKRLLVRDGERLWLVDAGAVLSDIKQLMPSAGEQAGYYERHDRWSGESRQVTRDDLGYAKAQREQIGALDRYGQVLIVLWGLHDRLDLFEAAAIPKFTNWLDPAFQNRYLQLVSVDTLIAVERPSFASWQAAQNEYLVSGSWVAVDLKTAFTQSNAPGAYSNGSYYSGRTHYELVYRTDLPKGQPTLIERARADKDGVYVEVPCAYNGYRDVSRRQANIKLRISTNNAIIDGVLVLDRVRAADLTYYLESRQQRRHYASYVPLFREACRWVAERDAAEAPLRQQLRAAVNDARIAHDSDSLESQLTSALAIARTARRDRTIPTPGTAAHRAFLAAAMAALHAALTDNTGRIGALEAWAQSNGRELLRLVLTGQDVWKLYLVPLESEHDPRLGVMAHASVAHVCFEARGEVQVAVFGRELLRAVAGEQVIHDWNREVPRERSAAELAEIERHPSLSSFYDGQPKTRIVGTAEWLAKKAPFKVSYGEAMARLDAAIAQSAAFDAGLDLPALVAECRRWMHDKSKSYVERMSLRVAIGSALNYSGMPVLLVANVDALRFAFHQGDDAVKQACRDVVCGIYQNKEAMLRRLEEAAPKWMLATAPIDEIGALQQAGSSLERGVDKNACVRPGKTCEGYNEIQIMAVTPAGVRLLPWLAEVTLSALEQSKAS